LFPFNANNLSGSHLNSNAIYPWPALQPAEQLSTFTFVALPPNKHQRDYVAPGQAPNFLT